VKLIFDQKLQAWQRLTPLYLNVFLRDQIAETEFIHAADLAEGADGLLREV
jgi:hypothetical protein